MKKKQAFVNVIIVNYNGKELLKECLGSLSNIDYPKKLFEITVVDNCSQDGSLEFLRNDYKSVKVIESKINNYCYACNLGIKNSINADYIALLNNDVMVEEKWLSELVRVMEADGLVGASTSRLLREDGNIQNAGLYELPDFYWEERGAGKDAKDCDAMAEVDAVCGASVLYRKAALNQAGLLDEDFVMFGEDVDMSLRLKKKGWKLVYLPGSLAYHKMHGSCDESFARRAIERNRLLLIAKHYPRKLSNSLLGNKYFVFGTNTKDSGQLFDLIPQIILKVVKEHDAEVAHAVLGELLLELKKIVNYDNKNLEDELKNTLVDLIETKKDRDRSKADQEFLTKEMNNLQQELTNYKEEISNLGTKLRRSLEDALFKDTLIKRLQQDLTNYKEEASNLGTKLRRSLNDVLSKDALAMRLQQELVHYKEDISNYKKEVSKLGNRLKESLYKDLSKDALTTRLQEELASCKEEISNLSNKLRQSMDDILSKETLIKRLQQEITNYKEEASNLDTKLRQDLDDILTKDALAMRFQQQLANYKEEVSSYKEEISNLSNKLRESLYKDLSKDALTTRLQEELANCKEEISNLGAKLKQNQDDALSKDALIMRLQQELASYKEVSSLSNKLTQNFDDILSKDTLIMRLQQELANYKEEVSSLSTKLRRSLDEGLTKDALTMKLQQELTNHREEISNLSNKLRQGLDEKLRLEKELTDIYSSTGFRFILRPLWNVIWFGRMSFKYLIGKAKTFIWIPVTFVMLAFIMLEALFFIIEGLFEILFNKVSLRRKSEREAVSFEQLTVSVVIPNWNGLDLLKKCLSSIYDSDDFRDSDSEVLVVDDASTDDIAPAIKNDFPKVRVIRNERNQGFGRSCNIGVRNAKGELIVLLNNDIMVTKNFLKPLKAHFKDKDVFAVSPKLYYWDKKTFNYGMHMGRFEGGYLSLWNEAETGNGDRILQTAPTVFTVGGAMVFRKKDFMWLGGFDDIYRPNCWEDIDISYRAQQRGLKVLYEPSSLVYHKGAATLNYVRHKEIKNELLFMWKNIRDNEMLFSHFINLPKFFFRGRHSNREVFLMGYIWAFCHIIPLLINRFREKRYLLVSDKAILDRCMLYYRNFRRSNYTHTKRKTVLLVTPFLLFPLNCGGKVRIYNLYKRLAKKYNLINLSLIHHEKEKDYIAGLKEIFTEVYTVHTKTPCREILFPQQYRFSYSSFFIDKIQEIQEKMPLDIVHIESNELLYLAEYVKYIPIVYTEHDISILSYRNSYYHKGSHDAAAKFIDYLKLIRFHHNIYSKIRHTIVLSEEDKKVVNAFSPQTDCALIHTGVDLEHFRFCKKTGKDKSLIFVGHYPHYPNEEAAVFFSKYIFPIIKEAIPDVTLKLVGSCPTEEIIKLSRIVGIKVIGEVPDVGPFLRRSSVFVTAFKRSSGIRGKVLEAMSSGVPVVSTTRGAYGIEAKDGMDIFIADNPQDFARRVIELLTNDDLYKRIAHNGRKLVEEKYDWNKITAQLDNLYSSVISDINDKEAPSTESNHNTDNKEERVVVAVDERGAAEVSVEDNKKCLIENAVVEYGEESNTGEDGASGRNSVTALVSQDAALIEKITGKIDRIISLSLEHFSKDKFEVFNYPEELHIELTHLCNSRCITCDIWDYHRRNNKSANDELSLSEIENLIKSNYLKEVKTVVLSGGEPFLRKDIVDICSLVNKILPQASVGILTNGIDTDNIINKIKSILKILKPDSFWLGSSLDGLDEAYDKMRGIVNGFSYFSETLKRLKRELPEVRLSTTFVLTPFNIGQLVPCWEFADKNGLDFFAQFGVPKPSRSAKVFEWKEEELRNIEECVSSIIKRLITKDSSLEAFYDSLSLVSDKINLVTKIYYWRRLVDFQRNRKSLFHRCDAGFKFAMFDPYGNFFFCPLLKEKTAGNLRQRNFDDLWLSKEADSVRAFIEKGACSCWLVCTVFPILNKALSLYGNQSAAGAPVVVNDEAKKEEGQGIVASSGRSDDLGLNGGPQEDKKESVPDGQLNNAEFREKKIILKSSPQGITIGTNYNCNAKCMFCLGGEYRPFSLGLYRDYLEPKLSVFLKNAGFVSFCGMGELLLMPDIEKFLDYVNTVLPFQNKILTTNGLALKGNALNKVTEGKYSVQISLHASYASLHAQLTGLKDGFEKIIGQIKWLVSRRKNKESPYIVLVFLLNSMNIENLPNFVELASSLGVDCIQCNYLTIFKPAHLKLSCFFSQELTNEMFDKAARKAEEQKISLILPPRFSSDANSYFKAACGEPWRNIYVDTEGAVLPCCYSGEHFGELEGVDLLSVWNNKKYQQLREDLVSGEAVQMCKYCLNSNSVNVNLLNAHVSFRPEVQKEIFG